MNLPRLILLFFCLNAEAKIEAIIGPTPLKDNPNFFVKIPDSKESEIIISRDEYIVSYNKFRRVPNWVMWKLDKSSMGGSGRSNNFQQDSDLNTYLKNHDEKFMAVNENEYKGSCFDRGHQIPSADRTTSYETNSTTFFMSNMVPQTAFLNRTIWENLESHTRELVKNQNKKVYVIAGSIFDEDFGKIGPNKDIAVPSKAFKVIYILDQNQNISDISKLTPSISVIMPNRLKDGSKPDFKNGCTTDNEVKKKASFIEKSQSQPWEKYQAPISEIEEVAGIDL